MTAPGRPLEARRLPAPRPRPGGAVLETVASEVCGTDVHLHHGRLSGVPYPIIPGHVSVGRVLESNGPLHDVEGRADRAGNARHVLRRLRNLRRLLALPRRARRDALPASQGLRHHRGGGGRPARRLVGADRNPSGRPAGAAARRDRRRGLPRRRLRPADRLSRRRARRDRDGRHRRRPGLGARWPERRDLRAALGGAARSTSSVRRRRRLEAARRLGADDTLDITRVPSPRRPRRLGARPHARPRAPTSSSRPRATRRPFRRASRCSATAAATSSSASTPTPGTPRSTPTARSTASTRRSWAAGATSSRTSTGRSP